MSHHFEMFTQFGGLSDANRFRARFEPRKWISISLKRETREKSVVAISVDFELYKTRNIDQMNLDQNLRENGSFGSPRFTRQRLFSTNTYGFARENFHDFFIKITLTSIGIWLKWVLIIIRRNRIYFTSFLRHDDGDDPYINFIYLRRVRGK